MKKITLTLIVVLSCLSLSAYFVSCSAEERSEETGEVKQETTEMQEEAGQTAEEMNEETEKMADETKEEVEGTAGKMKQETNEMAGGGNSEEIVVAEAEQKGDPVKGKEKYNQICASCHGESGKGDGPAAAALDPKPRDHTDAEYMSTLSDQDMFKVISEGGAAVGKSPLMPAWGGTLSEQDIWNVIAYIRQNICKCEYKGK